MTLKEAFRYQNKLSDIIRDAMHILNNDSNIVKVENTYLRKKVMPEAEDEKVVVVPETEYRDEITKVTEFLVYILDEKERLYKAIRKAKNALDIDIDSEVSLNSLRQNVANIFKGMNNLRSSEQTIQGGGTGYRFNTDGNQVSYRCDVRKVTTINFDRNVVRRELDKLNRKADEVSAAIDLCTVTTQVDYEPPFDVNVSFADAFDAFRETGEA